MQYPNRIKKGKTKDIIYANRGMTLESDLNITNHYYLEKDTAIINKKPTPIKVVKIVFDSQKKATIKEAYFEKPSTTDYNGLYQGQYIDFEAKETKNTKAFPLNNINAHQIKHMENIINHHGIAFLIVRFTLLNKTFILKGETLIDFINHEQRKAVPLSIFLEKGYEIKEAYTPRLDYLTIINKIYFQNNKKECMEAKI